jgi:thioredoxin-like negative regulator of GroEL
MGLIGECSSGSARGATPGWEDAPPLAPAVKRAAQAKRLLLVKVGTAWCSSCRKLEQVLGTREVQEKLSGYLKLAYDAEAGEGRDVAERYNVVAFPTLLLLGADGREVGRVTGDHPESGPLAPLEKIREGSERLEELERRLSKGPGDLPLHLRLGTEWALRGSKAEALRHLDHVLQADADNRKKLAAQALLVRGKYLLLRSLKDYQAAAHTLKRLRARYPGSPEAGEAVYSLAQALHGGGQPAEALRLLQGWAKTAEAHDAVAWFCLRHEVAPAVGLLHAQKAVALAPREASHFEHLAELQELEGQPQEAARSWARATALDPSDARYRRRRELLLRQLSPSADHPKR